MEAPHSWPHPGLIVSQRRHLQIPLIYLRVKLLIHKLCFFCVGYFWEWVLFYIKATLDHNPPICISLSSRNDRCISLHSAIGWIGALRSFHPCWPSTVISLISVSWVARITGVSIDTQPVQCLNFWRAYSNHRRSIAQPIHSHLSTIL
jgi:hypothetical protein